MVSAAKNLLSRHLKHFEQDLDKIWSVEVVEVLHSEVKSITRLHSPYQNIGVISTGFFEELQKRCVEDSFHFREVGQDSHSNFFVDLLPIRSELAKSDL